MYITSKINNYTERKIYAGNALPIMCKSSDPICYQIMRMIILSSGQIVCESLLTEFCSLLFINNIEIIPLKKYIVDINLL